MNNKFRNVTIPFPVWEKLRAIASENHRSASAQARVFIEEGIKELDKASKVVTNIDRN